MTQIQKKQTFSIYTSAIILLLTLINTNTSFSQPHPFYFTSVTEKNNLPDNTIYTIFQDNTGFIWYGTGKGLVRFDGNDYKLFKKGNIQDGRKINSYRITHITQTSDGLIWISTSDNGINVYNPITEKFTYYNTKNNSSMASNNIQRCYQDSKGRIWICTLGEGLKSFDETSKSFTHFKHEPDNPNSLPNNNLTDIIEDSNGNLWIANEENHITRFNVEKEQFTRYQTHYEDMNMGGFYKHLYFTDSTTLWIATDGTGLYKLNTNTGQFKRFIADSNKGSINSNFLKGLISDKWGNIIIITDGGGVNYFDTETETFSAITYDLSGRNNITTNALYSIYKDKSNNIIIGTFKAGLLRLKENNHLFSFINQNNNNKGLPHKSVLSIHEDKNGYIWYGTDGGGASRYNPITKELKNYQFDPNNKNSLSSNVVTDIAEDTEGNLWFATFFGGLNMLNTNTGIFTRYQIGSNNKNSISSNSLWCLLIDSKNRLWIGNFSVGLDYLDLSTRTFVNISQNHADSTTLSHNQVTSLIEGEDNHIWVGTFNGLNLLNTETMQAQRFYHNPNDSLSLSNNAITCLFFDSKKQLWIGTENGGLNLMTKPGIFVHYGIKEDVLKMAILSIQEDSSGKLWISTKNGILKFDPANNSFLNFNHIEDFISNEFNWNSSTKDSDGNLYFGSIDGACKFKPEDIVFDHPFPRLVFTGIKANNRYVKPNKNYPSRLFLNKSVTFGGQITLTPSEKSFTIEFAALEFNKPQNIYYKYRLKGFDNEWIFTDANHRNANYTNLPGGNYIFEVYSTNSIGHWNPTYSQLHITIIPPIFKRWWFKSLVFMVFLFLAGWYYKKALHKQKLRIQELARKRENELITKRNNELKGELASSTMLILKKNESMEQIKEALNLLSSDSNNFMIINKISRLIDTQMETDSYWEQFQYNFDQVYTNMLSRLKLNYPDLTQTNLKLCAYLRLNLSSKEIASLMNITKAGVDKARNRLRKKLLLDPSHDLYEFLINF